MSRRSQTVVVTVAVVLSAAGLASALWGLVKHKRKASRIRSANYAVSAKQIRARMENEKSVTRSEAYFKLTGIAESEHPVAAPLSRNKAVHVRVQTEIGKTAWGTRLLRMLLAPTLLSNVLLPRQINNQRAEASWMLKLPDGSYVAVMTEGAEWVLEETVKEHRTITAPLAHSATSPHQAKQTSPASSPTSPITPTLPALSAWTRFWHGLGLASSTNYYFTSEALIRNNQSVFILGHVKDLSGTISPPNGIDPYAHYADSGPHTNGHRLEPPAQLAKKGQRGQQVSKMLPNHRAEYDVGSATAVERYAKGNGHGYGLPALRQLSGTSPTGTGPVAWPQQDYEHYYWQHGYDQHHTPTLMVQKPLIRWFLISALSEEVLLNNLDWKWRAWFAAGMIMIAAAAMILVVL